MYHKAVQLASKTWGKVAAHIAPEFFVPTLAREVVGFPDQCPALAPLFRRPLGEDACHRSRLGKLFREGFAVTAGERGRVDRGIVQGKELAAIRQHDRIIEATFPIRSLRSFPAA